MKADILSWRIVGLIGFLFCGAATIGAALSGAYLAAVGFILFFLLSGVLLWLYGPVIVDDDGISMRTPSGRMGMQWREMRSVEYGQSHFVFIGEKKRLVIPHPMFWSGKNKGQVAVMIDMNLQTLRITPTRSIRADFMFSKNMRRAT